MPLFRSPSKKPLWKEEFSVLTSDERYVTRRQFTKFLTLASLGMFVGNLWILVKARFAKARQFSGVEVAQVGEIPIRGVKLFTYPTPEDHCIMVRIGEDEYVAYSQKCTHLSCAVLPRVAVPAAASAASEIREAGSGELLPAAWSSDFASVVMPTGSPISRQNARTPITSATMA